MKIKAKGMFRKLGYRQERILNDRFILYKKPSGIGYCCIRFDLEYHTFYAQFNYEAKCITVDEFKAIQQQMKELGWI